MNFILLKHWNLDLLFSRCMYWSTFGFHVDAVNLCAFCLQKIFPAISGESLFLSVQNCFLLAIHFPFFLIFQKLTLVLASFLNSHPRIIKTVSSFQLLRFINLIVRRTHLGFCMLRKVGLRRSKQAWFTRLCYVLVRSVTKDIFISPLICFIGICKYVISYYFCSKCDCCKKLSYSCFD